MLLIDFLKWFYIEAPKNIFRIWKNFILFFYNFFSIELFIKTLFYPWKHYQIKKERGFSLKNFAEIAIFNLFSRFIGFSLKTLIIFLGLLAEILLIFLGIGIFILWLIMPLFILFTFYKAFQFII